MQDFFNPTPGKRAFLYMVIDIFFTFIALYFAYLLRFDFSVPYSNLTTLPISWLSLIFIRVAVFYRFDLYTISWRYFGLIDNLKLVYLLILSTALFTIVVFMFRDSLFSNFPRSVIPIEFFISLVLFSLFRNSKRIFLEVLNKNTLGDSTVIVASNDIAEEISRVLLKRSSTFCPVAIINSNRGIKINGIRVLGFDEIKLRYNNIKVAIISEEYDIKDVYEKLKEINIKRIKQYSKITDIKQAIKDVTVEDLLARNPKDLDKEAIELFLKGKKVLVTGAGGSIGSEICRQCLRYGVEKLNLLDHSEFNLYTIKEELKSDKISSYLQNIVNKKALEKTISICKPDIVIHAAAYKHVPLVEENIAEGIENNIIGTKNCIDLSVKYGVEKFILISTDKAVRPTNVMGATKRVCELYAGSVDSKSTDIVAVRFGNVLGSSGSVIPKFKKQIEEGGPVTVTHPEITRYFMLIPEACELVLQTGAIAKGRETFILDMGEPVRIVDLAKNMIELSGKNGIEIEFIGLRKGEKLYEELLIEEGNKETKYSSILIAKNTNYDIKKLNQDIDELLICEDKIGKLQEIVPEFTHKL